jgi:hypothetical protein
MHFISDTATAGVDIKTPLSNNNSPIDEDVDDEDDIDNGGEQQCSKNEENVLQKACTVDNEKSEWIIVIILHNFRFIFKHHRHHHYHHYYHSYDKVIAVSSESMSYELLLLLP